MFSKFELCLEYQHEISGYYPMPERLKIAALKSELSS